MKSLLAAGVACSLLLAACTSSPPTSDSASTASTGTATPRLTVSGSPGSEPDKEQGSSQPRGVQGAAEVKCFGQRATIVGTPGDDRIRGTRGAEDTIVSLGGDDVITGVADRDRVCTGAGDDQVVDPRGGWEFVPLAINLGPGDDRMTVVDRGGLIRAGAGDDTIRVSRLSEATIALGAGDDVIRVAPISSPAHRANQLPRHLRLVPLGDRASPRQPGPGRSGRVRVATVWSTSAASSVASTTTC